MLSGSAMIAFTQRVGRPCCCVQCAPASLVFQTLPVSVPAQMICAYGTGVADLAGATAVVAP